MSAKDSFDMQIKLLTIGNSGVGKTCLLLRYSDNSFDATHIITIGIDYKTKIVDTAGKRIKLQMWDTAGQERFRTITRTYFRGSQGILLVYDVTNMDSFKGIEAWVDEIERNAGRVITILVANKIDVDDSERVVSREEGEALARKHGMPYFETSAKKDIGVSEAFQCLTEHVVGKVLSRTPRARALTPTSSEQLEGASFRVDAPLAVVRHPGKVACCGK